MAHADLRLDSGIAAISYRDATTVHFHLVAAKSATMSNASSEALSLLCLAGISFEYCLCFLSLNYQQLNADLLNLGLPGSRIANSLSTKSALSFLFCS
jgi:hypothetical protein